MSEATIFATALEKAPGEERAAYLAEACGGNDQLRLRVEALLRVHAGADDILDAPRPPQESPEITGAFVPGGEGVGTVFARRFKLREKLGEGGMGVVFVADQTEPVQRRVALKVIKTGADSACLLARFEQERQALALMDHPNIAKVLDAGVNETGQPYFVMELVKGVSFTRYCDTARLTARQRLELFIPVCQAVQHAHQKGIIHRDLKPTNILIGLYDGRPVPKVIDFGVAKATGARLTEQSIYTEVGSLIGTLEYMSPEQAELNNLDIDTRSDIYALGVILYELLTGVVPFSRKELQSAGFAEMLRIIKEEEPSRPSTKLSGSGQLPSVAAERQTEPKKLTRLVRGELDWIAMKCLEKDRSRRYETANGLAQDLQRYLADEPVLAGPPSVHYRLRKFIARNNGPVLAASIFFLLLVGGIIGTTLGLIEAKRQERLALAAQHEEAERAKAEARERQRAELAESEAKTQKADALGQKKQALASAADARAVLAFFQDKVLAAGRPEGEQGGLGKDVTLRQAVDAAAPGVRASFQDQPLVEASIRSVLGDTFYYLGEPALAIPQVERARALRQVHLGTEHPDTLTCMNDLGNLYMMVGKLDLALPLLEETLKLRTAKLGPEHPDTLTSMNSLASTFHKDGKLTLALPLFEETLKLRKAKLGLEHPQTLTSMNNLANAYGAAGKVDLALSLHLETLKLHKAKLGPEHPGTLRSMANLAGSYWRNGKLDLALPLFEESLKLRKAKLGPQHPDTLASMNNLAIAYRDVGKLDQALPLFEETLQLRKAKLGPEHLDTLVSMNNLAGAYRDAGKLNLALPLHEETLKLTKARLGPEHPDTLTCMNDLGNTYRASGKLDLALPLFEETLKLTKAELGPEHSDTLTCMNDLAVAYLAAGKPVLALPLLQETLQLRKANLGPEHPRTLIPLNNLVIALAAAGKHDEAVPLCHEAIAIQRRKSPPDDPALAGSLTQLGGCLLHADKPAEAEPVLRESLAIRQKKQPDHWSTFNAQSLLGGALLGQKKYADAEPLLLAGYEGMKKREDKIPAAFKKRRLTDALERLVQLYEATDKKDKAAEWRKNLEEAKTASKLSVKP